MTNHPMLEDFVQIAEGLYLEGLAIDHDRDIIWYSDVIGGGIHGVRPDGSKVASFDHDRMWTGGVLVNDGGILLSSGETGIMWNDPMSGKQGWLIKSIDGKPINGINEMIPDGEGGIYFGTSDIEKVILGEATRPTELYRLTRDLDLCRVAGNIGFSNGLMFDAGRMQLYCNDTFRGTQAFTVAADRSLKDQRFFLEKEDADGMALDEAGNVWITGFRSSHFALVTPDGTRLPDVPTPAGSITQLRFGGTDGCDCYFNSVPSDGGDTLKDGGAILTRNSFLYKARASVPGRRIEPTHFRLG
ncbi:MAG: SMP-30/gluconolactonase/LRE family protein [Sphingobium sp.]